MSWNVQNLNQRSNNSTAYPFGNINRSLSSASYSPNSTLQHYPNHNHNRNHTQITPTINQINEYNNHRNRNAFGGRVVHNKPTTIHYSNAKPIQQMNASQLKHIELPPLPQELQLQNYIRSNNKRSNIQTQHTTNNNTIHKRNGSVPFNNLCRSNSQNSIHGIKPHTNGFNPMLSNAQNITRKHLHHTNNSNINHNGHNTNYMMNNNKQLIEQLIRRNAMHMNNNKTLQRSQSAQSFVNAPKSFHRTPKSYQAVQQMQQNVINRGRIVQNKPKQFTQNRIKLRFKRPRFDVNKQIGNSARSNTINRMHTIDLPPAVNISSEAPSNKARISNCIHSKPSMNGVHNNNIIHQHPQKPPMHTSHTAPISPTAHITAAMAPNNRRKTPDITVTIAPPKEHTEVDIDNDIKMENESKQSNDSQETKTTQSISGAEDDKIDKINVHIDKIETTKMDDEQLVDIHGVKWDDTVNWVCGVCEGADAQKDNALVVCEGCSRAVHQHCYGITPKQMASDKDWYCRCCEYKGYILDNNTLLEQLRNIYEEYTLQTSCSVNHKNNKWTVSKLLRYKEKTARAQNGFVVNASENTRSRRAKRNVEHPIMMDYLHDNQVVESENPFDDVILPLNVLTDANTTRQTFFDGKTLPQCSLCCTLGGAYKLSVDRRWVHLCCCIYHPNVYFSCPKYSNDPVLSEITMQSANAMCNACRSSIGACIQCTATQTDDDQHTKCSQWFHVTCMQQHNLYLYSEEEALTAYCKQHTTIFKEKKKKHIQETQMKPHNRKRGRTRLSGRKRRRSEADTEYTPKAKRTKSKNRTKRARSSTKRKRKDKKASLQAKDKRREFSPEASDREIEYLNHRVQQYIDALFRDDDGDNNAKAAQHDDISSISSQEIDERAKPKNIRIPAKKKRKKSAVDLLSHSSFALKRNKWIFNQTFHVYPNRDEFYESKDFESAQDMNPNPNHWTLETTTDPTQMVAEQCMRSVETLWTHRQTNLLAKSQNSRDYRKAIGFSILRNPNGDVITSCNWSFWEVSATKKAVLIKLFITEPYSKSRVPQRRKKNGTLLAAHVMDISFRLRDDVDWVVICSERGIAEIFWRALGFVDFSQQEKRSFCRGTEKDLNQFRDTILLRMHHNDYIKKYCNNTNDWQEDNCAVQKVFRKWRKKHLFMKRNIVFKHKANIVHTHKLSSY